MTTHTRRIIYLVIGLLGIKLILYRKAKSTVAATKASRAALQTNAANAVANQGPTASGLPS